MSTESHRPWRIEFETSHIQKQANIVSNTELGNLCIFLARSELALINQRDCMVRRTRC